MSTLDVFPEDYVWKIGNLQGMRWAAMSFRFPSSVETFDELMEMARSAIDFVQATATQWE